MSGVTSRIRLAACALATVTLFGLLVGIAPTDAQAVECKPFEFVGARGSGEVYRDESSGAIVNNGMGTLLGSATGVYSQLASLVGQDQIGAYGVEYPAVGLTDSISDYLNAAGAFLHIKPLGAYTDSVREGTAAVQSHIESVHASCPSTNAT